MVKDVVYYIMLKVESFDLALIETNGYGFFVLIYLTLNKKSDKF
jgi:hypothetical protein